MNNRHFFQIILLLLSIITFAKCTEKTDTISSINLSSNKLTIKSKKNFSSNESLKFSIDTGEEKGFIYLVYIDKKGSTSLLYPNENATQKKKSGTLKFPEDFGGIDVKTTKDCRDCKKEKTTIFVLLSNDPVENIQDMNEDDLANIQRGHKSRSILSTQENREILVNKIDFFVE